MMDLDEIRRELEYLKRKVVWLKLILDEFKETEAGKLSIPDNQGGELSIINTGMLSLKE